MVSVTAATGNQRGGGGRQVGSQGKAMRMRFTGLHRGCEAGRGRWSGRGRLGGSVAGLEQ